MIEHITSDREAWTDFNEEQLRILDDYLEANDLPEPKFMGRGRYYTRNSKCHSGVNLVRQRVKKKLKKKRKVSREELEIAKYVVA